MSGGMFDREAFDIEQLDDEARQEILGAYLDDELSPEAARHVMAWLDDHPDLLREVEHLRRVWDLLELYEDERVPEAFATDVLAGAGVRRRASPAGRQLVLPRPALFLAAAAVLLVGLAVGLWMAQSLGPDPAPAPAAQAEVVPAEYLEEVDVLLALSDDEFRAYLLTDLEEPWGDGS